MRGVRIGAGVCIAGLLSAGVAGAQSTGIDVQRAKSLFESNECAGCHQIDTKLVGPGLKQIAGRYRDDKDAPRRLLEKVRKGGAGVWGEIPMPPHAEAKDDELKLVISWILSQ